MSTTWAEERTLAAILAEVSRIRELLEGLQVERFVDGVRRDPILPPCSSCGGVGGFHSRTCPQALSDHPRF